MTTCRIPVSSHKCFHLSVLVHTPYENWYIHHTVEIVVTPEKLKKSVVTQIESVTLKLQYKLYICHNNVIFNTNEKLCAYRETNHHHHNVGRLPPAFPHHSGVWPVCGLHPAVSVDSRSAVCAPQLSHPKLLLPATHCTEPTAAGDWLAYGFVVYLFYLLVFAVICWLVSFAVIMY